MSQPSFRSRNGGPQMRDQAVPIFHNLSTEEVSPLYVIRDRNPVITAYNLPPDTIIWVEMVELTDNLATPWREGCCFKDFPPQDIISVNRIRCSQCDADTDAQQVEQFARITTKNPVIELNLPYGTYWQLRWDGPGLGDVFVRLWESNRKFDATYPTVTNGCPCIQYIDDPSLWIPTNVIRCNEDTGNVEGEFRSPDAQFTAWFVVEPILWRDTGATREYCDVTAPEGKPDPNNTVNLFEADVSFQKQQINQCGYVQWVNTDCMTWRATGNDRELIHFTEGISPDEDEWIYDDEEFERQMVNQFGRFRWDIVRDMSWTDTGKYRSVCPDTNDDYEKQQVNQFGRFRWVPVDCVNWTDTGQARELCEVSDEEYEIEQSNQFGGTQWIVSECAMVWTDTGETREKVNEDPSDTFIFDDEIYERQQVNRFGRFRWIDTEYVSWEDTGEIREVHQFVEPDPSVVVPPVHPFDFFKPEDLYYEKQQINQFRRLRWIEASTPQVWTDTGVQRINTSGQVEKQEVNQFSRFRWVEQELFLASVLFTPYKDFGETQTLTTTTTVTSVPAVEVVQEIERTNSAVVLEKGYGFIAGDVTADPEATVLVPHPVTGVTDFVAIYPAPLPNATVEVYDTLAIGPRVLLGYARNNPLGLLS